MDEEVERLKMELSDPDPIVRTKALDRTIAVLREKRLDPSFSEPSAPIGERCGR